MDASKRFGTRADGTRYLITTTRPVTIGKDCWIGGNATIFPGVTIGDNVVVGAGSIVTRDLPSNVVAVGNPCHVLREVGERDREYYFKDRRIDWNEMRADEAAH